MLSGNDNASPRMALDYATPALHEGPHDIRIKALEKQVKRLMAIISDLEQEIGALRDEVDNLP